MLIVTQRPPPDSEIVLVYPLFVVLVVYYLRPGRVIVFLLYISHVKYKLQSLLYLIGLAFYLNVRTILLLLTTG